MNYEEALISKILTEGCLEEVLDARVSVDLFESHKDVWEYVLEVFREHGSVPPVDTVEQRFRDFSMEVSETSMTFFISELRKRWVHNTIATSMKVQADLLKKREPLQALDEMRETLLKAEVESRPAKDLNIVEEPERRITAYEDIVKAGGVTGIPTPWACFNEVTQGFNGEELIMMAGRSGIGKTWCEAVLACAQWSLGYTPILFSREMAVHQIVRRIDAVHAQLPYQRFRSGLLTTDEFERWSKSLAEMKDGLPFWVTGDDEGRLGVSGIAAKIHRYKPSIVYIDGGYLLEDERGARASWERWSNVCRDLKKLAQQENLPIVLSHQFNLEGKDDKGDADTLKYGDVQMWFDLIVGLYQTEDLRLNKEMLFKINKQREGERLEWVTEWDLDKMVFEVKSEGRDDVGEAVPYEEDSEGDRVPF